MKLSQALFIFVCITLCSCHQQSKPGAEQVLESTGYYQELHRPQYHFSPGSMWMNDPNGMVYYEGEYHLFYQYYPDSTVWGPMHWGHAVSRDLVHWEHLPIALYPDSLGYIFSGSAVIDYDNTSGLGTADTPAMVAIYTYHDMEGEHAGRIDIQSQAIAYSLDRGRSWTKYADNPVIPNPGIRDFRDPKVFWHAPTQKWVMIFAAGDRVRIYNSADLLQWELVSEFGKDHGSHGGVWECPDLFPLEINGEEKWVMIVSLGDGAPNGGSGTQYFVGNFDGKTFTSDHSPSDVYWLDYGRDNYAGVTWSGIPREDGRRIFIGWMSNWKYANLVPTKRWRSAMTLPRTLGLRQTEKGTRLISQPIKELNGLRSKSYALERLKIAGEYNLSQRAPFPLDLSELVLKFDSVTSTSQFEIELSNDLGEKVVVGFQGNENRFYIDRTEPGKVDFESGFPGVHFAPRISMAPGLSLHIFIDVSSIEVFADDGEVVMTDVFFPNQNFTTIKILSPGEGLILDSGEIYALDPIWK